jgi:phosphatidylserine decarboxylase
MTFKLFLQYILPHRAVSRVVYWATRWTFAPWKNFLIGQIVRRYQIDMSQAAQPDPFAYSHFNAFFTRKLRPDARRADTAPDALIAPADGRISQAGPITDGRIFQAKGQSYSVAELLGDEGAASPYRHGRFVTIYLSPRDYHRVHMPLSGTLKETVHIPGRIFSVAPFAVAGIPRLFARNERLVCHFEGPQGRPFVVVMVGAILVSSVATVWDGLVIPPYASSIRRKSFAGQHIQLERFAEMARFNMGSTVIVLLPEGAGELDALTPQQVVNVGQRIGEVHHI